MSGDQAFTAEERGQSDSRLRGAARIVILALVAGATVAIVFGHNLIADRVAPWLGGADAEPASVLTGEGAVTTPKPGDAAPLVEAEDSRLATLSRLDAADPRTRAEFHTLVLGARAEPYGLGDLVAAGAVRQDDERTFTLVSHVMVRTGAELALNAPGVVLRMLSGPEGNVSIVGWGGVAASPSGGLRVRR